MRLSRQQKTGAITIAGLIGSIVLYEKFFTGEQPIPDDLFAEVEQLGQEAAKAALTERLWLRKLFAKPARETQDCDVVRVTTEMAGMYAYPAYITYPTWPENRKDEFRVFLETAEKCPEQLIATFYHNKERIIARLTEGFIDDNNMPQVYSRKEAEDWYTSFIARMVSINEQARAIKSKLVLQ